MLVREAVATIPPRRSARLSESVDPPAWRAMRDAHLREIRRLGRYEWRISSGCTRQSLAENAMFRFKTLFGPKLSARRFDNQRVEAIIKCEVLNRMSSRGMPESVRIPIAFKQDWDRSVTRPELCNNAYTFNKPPSCPTNRGHLTGKRAGRFVQESVGRECCFSRIARRGPRRTRRANR